MEGNKLARPTPLPAEGEAAARAVLGNDDLLREILLQLGFPTTLVRAALVCRRWYGIASDPDFLRCFRQLHPPRLLGFYCDTSPIVLPQFVPLAEAPELATAVRCAISLGIRRFSIRDYRNDGRILIKCCDKTTTECGPQVLRPLQPARGVTIHELRPLSDFTNYPGWFLFLLEDGSDDGFLIVEPSFGYNGSFQAKVCTFKSGICTAHTIQVNGLLFPDPDEPDEWHSVKRMLQPVRGKIYMTVNSRFILELDMVAESVSVIHLPDAVNTDNYKISCREDSGLVLVHANGSLLSIWRRTSGNDGLGEWVLVDDAIRVREAYNRHEDVTVFVIANNLEYVFLGLKTSRLLVSMHLQSRTEKLHGEVSVPHFAIEYRFVPFMMVWPPIFPALTEANL